MCQEVCLFRLSMASLCWVSVSLQIRGDSEPISAEGQGVREKGEFALFNCKLSLQELGVCLSVCLFYLPSVRAELHIVRSIKQNCTPLPQTRWFAQNSEFPSFQSLNKRTTPVSLYPIHCIYFTPVLSIFLKHAVAF